MKDSNMKGWWYWTLYLDGTENLIENLTFQECKKQHEQFKKTNTKKFVVTGIFSDDGYGASWPDYVKMMKQKHCEDL
jgi:hypothetical protein